MRKILLTLALTAPLVTAQAADFDLSVGTEDFNGQISIGDGGNAPTPQGQPPVREGQPPAPPFMGQEPRGPRPPEFDGPRGPMARPAGPMPEPGFKGGPRPRHDFNDGARHGFKDAARPDRANGRQAERHPRERGQSPRGKR